MISQRWSKIPTKKEPELLSVTSLKKDVEAFFGMKPSGSQDTSWYDARTSDFQKPALLGKMSHPLMMSVSDRDSRWGAWYFRKDSQERHEQQRSYPGPTEYNADVHPRRRELNPTPPREGYVIPAGDISQNKLHTRAIKGYPDFSLARRTRQGWNKPCHCESDKRRLFRNCCWTSAASIYVWVKEILPCSISALSNYYLSDGSESSQRT